ncbi:unnamed protein product [Ceratitis capitata]|uniref:(Mediterranean fruit fly) hypothetical protein n=1 Tax=Ceratitis capitata TaxID=7213 RepID=A0A811UB59_CERCA|nr:unnamed protein product [Ceratitis capitata]
MQTALKLKQKRQVAVITVKSERKKSVKKKRECEECENEWTFSHDKIRENESISSQSHTLFGDYGNIGRIRRRHHPRGTKRGRPRGSTRRGGGNGTLGRSLSSPGNGNVTTSGTPTGEDSSHSTSLTNLGAAEASFTTVPTPMKRGPGRPRLKTAGPIYQGTRGSPRTRKPIGPLVVPLGRSPGATPMTRSPVVSRAPSPSLSERSSHSTTGVPLGTPKVGSTGAVAKKEASGS